MAQLMQFLWLLAVLLWSAVCAPLEGNPPEALVRPKMPGNDEWYRPEPGFDKLAPGTILKYRPVPKGISFNNKDALKVKGAWQILYRTQNSLGEPDATVVTLVAPNNPKPQSLFVYHWFADSSFRECIPSIGIQPGTREDNAYTQVQTAMVLIGLNQGWYVAVTDDGGPDGVFASGKRAGYSVLDGLRAIKASSNFTGISPDPIITSYGYSGGSWAGAWASALRPTYAPDVNIAGTSIGGLLPNITQLTRNWNLPNRTSYAPAVFLGLAKDYKNLYGWIMENLKPERKDEFMRGENQCFDSNWDVFSGKLVGDYFKRGMDSLYDTIPVSVFQDTAEMERAGKPGNPWYVYESVGDDASPIWLADKIVSAHCSNGADITYERNPRHLGHSTEMVEGMAGAMRWVADRQLGKPITKGCTNNTQSQESAIASRQGVVFRGLIDVALGSFGVSVGPNWMTDFLAKFPQRVVMESD